MFFSAWGYKQWEGLKAALEEIDLMQSIQCIAVWKSSSNSVYSVKEHKNFTLCYMLKKKGITVRKTHLGKCHIWELTFQGIITMQYLFSNKKYNCIRLEDGGAAPVAEPKC